MPSYAYGTHRSTAHPFAGDYSLDVNGAWCSATFDNATNDHVWCTPDEGAFALRWKVVGPLTGGEMLFMITGKSSNPNLDTDDGCGLRFHGDDQLRWGYGWSGENWGSITIIGRDNWQPFELDHWYKVIVKYRFHTAPYLFIQIDDNEPVLGMDPPQPMTLVAFHQLLIGNDRSTTPNGLYIDEFEIYDDWDMTLEAQPGDADGDGDVDLDDFSILKNSFGVSPLTDDRADFDDDGDVDLDDFVVLKTNFGVAP